MQYTIHAERQLLDIPFKYDRKIKRKREKQKKIIESRLKLMSIVNFNRIILMESSPFV